eukprot:6214126-Pleurochrysis_carterae.AAC.2
MNDAQLNRRLSGPHNARGCKNGIAQFDPVDHEHSTCADAQASGRCTASCHVVRSQQLEQETTTHEWQHKYSSVSEIPGLSRYTLKHSCENSLALPDARGNEILSLVASASRIRKRRFAISTRISDARGQIPPTGMNTLAACSTLPLRTVVSMAWLTPQRLAQPRVDADGIQVAVHRAITVSDAREERVHHLGRRAAPAGPQVEAEWTGCEVEAWRAGRRLSPRGQTGQQGADFYCDAMSGKGPRLSPRMMLIRIRRNSRRTKHDANSRRIVAAAVPSR